MNDDSPPLYAVIILDEQERLDYLDDGDDQAILFIYGDENNIDATIEMGISAWSGFDELTDKAEDIIRKGYPRVHYLGDWELCDSGIEVMITWI